MKEAEIRKKVVEELSQKGWVCWFARKVRFWENDIFGVADMIILKGKKLRLIQLTTISNLSARRKKIREFHKRTKSEIPVELWGWDNKKREFRKEVC